MVVLVMAEFIGSVLNDEIVIDKLYTVHYFEYPKHFRFTGERHDFWELVYVDKGEVIVTAGSQDLTLHQGSIIFHKPNEWHNMCTDTVVSNVAIVTFECHSPAVTFFEDKILKVGQFQKTIISKIISEYTNAFSSPLNDLYTTQLIRKPSPTIGSEQLLKLYICELLISFLRDSMPENQHSLISINNSTATLNLLINYMHDNVLKGISMDDLVKYSGLNRTSITNIFKKNFNMSAIEYFINLKVDLAKKYLREHNHNVTQISEILGYSNVHYFSRQFKKTTGMSPIEYSHSIKAMTPVI